MPETIRLLTADELTPWPVVLGVLFLMLLLVACLTRPEPPARYICLLAADGDLVARIVPDERLKNGETYFPEVIEFQGKKYQRCTTQQFNTDAQERLWCEVTR